MNLKQMTELGASQIEKAIFGVLTDCATIFDV